MGNNGLYYFPVNILLEPETFETNKLSANISYSLNLEASFAVSTLSVLTFIILTALLIYYYMFEDDQVFNLGSPNNHILLFLGVVISATTALSIPNYDMKIYRVYLILLLIIVGIAVTVAGSHFFFRIPKDDGEKPISFQHKNLSLIIWFITIPLVLIELLDFICAIKLKKTGSKFKAAYIIVALIQKLIQACVYHFSLSYKVAHDNKKQGASWYLRILSLFNFAMWLDAMTRTEIEYIEEMFGPAWTIVNTAMVALLIDYRLLCCMVFAEHSMEVNEESREGADDDNNYIHVENVSEFKIRTAQLSGMGYVFGGVVLSLQLVCGLQNYQLVGHWSNIFAILADIFVVVLGLMLLSLDNEPTKVSGKWRKSEAKGMDLMVSMMGITGLLYWIIMTVFNASWAYRVDIIDSRNRPYLMWSCAKNIVRSIGIIFQLCIYIKCDPLFGRRKRVKGKRVIYFLLPALMLSFLSVFVMAIMDGHSRFVESLIEESGISGVLITLMKVSEPLYLGYTLHLFLHFFIVYNNVTSLEIRPRDSVDGDLEMDPLVA